MLVSKAYHLSFVQSKSASTTYIFEKQLRQFENKESEQRHLDLETVRFSKLFVEASWHVLSLFMPKQIDKLFLDVVLRELLKQQPYQTNEKLKH